MSLYPYPVNFPVEAVGVLLPILKGKVPAAASAIHAGWEVVGYGLLQMIPDSQVTAEGTFTADEVALWLETAESASGTSAALAIPWERIIAFLLPLILEWIQKKLTS